jgi:hypothetical protein
MDVGGGILKVNILGTDYEILRKKEEDEAKLKHSDGFCDTSVKQLVVGIFEKEPDSIEDLVYYTKKVTRHEIIHAFMYESGLWNNSGDVKEWATNEEMVDWIAIQFPKILKVFQEANCI